MPVLSDIEEYAMEQGLQKGREEGRQKGLYEGEVLARQLDILDALEARFGVLPEGAREAVLRVNDPARLRELLRLAVRAADMASFAKAL